MSVPPTSGKVKLPGLGDEVQVSYDTLGIAQVWASNESDAYFTLGYLHASDRLFQMDLTRRIATGRLSEMIGQATLALDRQQRRMGHLRMALAAESSLDEQSRSLLQAYTNGVNAYVKQARALPFEYRFLPEGFVEWKISDCLAILSFETWFSNALMNRDEFYRDLASKVGRERAKSLLFPYPDWAPATVQDGSTLKRSMGLLMPPDTKIPEVAVESPDWSIRHPLRRFVVESVVRDPDEASRMSNSSNTWVIAPSKSESGRAVLASDPHLELTRLPQFWYPVGIHTADNSVNVLGITAAGLPFFAMGHNGGAAWAFTAGGVDVLDYTSVAINPQDSAQYQVDGSWKDFTYLSDTFKVAGMDTSIVISQRYTSFGPVVSEEHDSLKAVAEHWAGFDVDLGLALKNAFALARVETFEEFRKIVTRLGALDANMVYADSAGNIGYQLTTPLLNRSATGGAIPGGPAVDDSTLKSEFVQLDRTPSALNPSEGWIANCNNLPSRMTPVSGYFFATRILSIDKLLKSKDKFSVADVQSFQMSRIDRYLLRMKPEFVRIAKLTEDNEQADLLDKWDGTTNADSKATALINVYLERLRQLTFEDELGGLWHQVPSKWIEHIDRVDSAGWFDDIRTPALVESYDTIAVRAMRVAIQAVDGRSWGELQSFSMRHPMGSIPILGSLLHLSTKREPWGGTPGALNASFYRTASDDSFESMAGPSWRFVVDFADVDSATMVIPAGVSGNPMTSHFLDFYPLWKSGKRWQVPFHHDAVMQRAVSTLTLLPPDSAVANGK